MEDIYTIWESTNGCCKQYRCGATLCCKYSISINFNVIIDRMIWVPGHEMDVADGTNSCDKCCLMGKCVWLLPKKQTIAKREWILIQWYVPQVVF